MDINNTSMDSLGLEYVKLPITAVRIHRTDGQWLVEFRRKPKWLIDGWWWFNDGKYVSYTDASERASKLSSQGYYLKLRYKRDQYVVIPHED